MTNIPDEQSARLRRDLARLGRMVEHAVERRHKVLGELVRLDRQIERGRQQLARLESRAATTVRIRLLVA